MDKKTKNRFEDMQTYAQKARDFVGDLNLENFETDEKTAFATIRAIEVIGEAAAQIDTENREAYQDIPWKEIIGMRNILIHQYSGVTMSVVYQTVSDFIPDLLNKLSKVLDS